jgi:tetratricopeptide (TPR) repeat protein
VPLEKSWRMVLEGALFEGRIGNQVEARKIFTKLLQECKSYGPVFFEASKYEEREGNIESSLEICEQGLDFNVKYSPLWFQYLHLYEKMPEKERTKRFSSLQTILNEMFQNIARELEWKIYIEAAQTYERLNDCDKAIGFLTNAIQFSPDNIKWKIWLIASRIQLKLGEPERAREIIERCCYDVPSKQIAMSLQEYAKHFEMRKKHDRARQIMQHSKRLSKSEWKTHFEAVLLEIRCGNFEDAERMVLNSLQVHFATGRLWATLIQLQHARAKTAEDFDEVYITFNKALKEIPKSGEVWCEGARLALSSHPSNRHFNFSNAESYLRFAI